MRESMTSMLRYVFLFLVVTSLAAAQAVPDVVAVNEHGLQRRYEIARTEAQRLRASDGMAEVVRLPDLGSAKELVRRLKSLEKGEGRKHDLVLYEAGKPRSTATRRVLTRQVVAELLPGTDATVLQLAVKATAVARPTYAPTYAIFDFADGEAALAAVAVLRAAAGVISAESVLARQHEGRFVPNDPRYAFDASNNTNYLWHLKNIGENGATAGEDVGGIETVWDTYRGNGITIGIVDDGLQWDHPDLSANATNAFHHDWNDTTPNDPRGRLTQDNHGTSCAGVAAAVGNNSVGVVGAAMNARLVGLRLIASPVGDVQEAEAVGWRTDIIHISNNSWGPPDQGTDLAGPGPLARAALEFGANNGRSGRGLIYMWAAGNGNDSGDRSSYDGWNNSPYTLSVGAVDDQGNAASYSENGPNLIISAPSNGTNRQGITTTSNAGYVDDFGGTSSATPLASGIVALMLQANPNLGWRDVQEILIRTARKNAPADADWLVNGAGFNFNHKFGAGVINAQAAVTMARNWTNLGARRSHIVSEANVNAAIPDNNATGIARTFNLTGVEQMRVEQVVLSLGITHPRRGDLDLRITSPSGVTSIFFVPHNDVQADIPLNFPFLSVRHWGENLQGTWTLRITDPTANNVGAYNSARLEFYGTRAAPVAATPVVTSATTVNGRQGSPFSYQITANNNPVSFDATGLPAGLTVNTSTGNISGTPTANGLINITVSATNTAGSGALNVSLNLADTAGNSFAEFRAAYMTLAQQADPNYADPEDDPDHDGISNLLEFALGGQPLSAATTIMPHLTTAAGVTYFEYQVDSYALGIEVTPQFSDTLDSTSWANLVPVLHSQNGSIQTWRVTLPAAGSLQRRFCRIQVSDLSAPRR
jgi:subtilisin-like proprotein convertase family protein